MYAQRSMLHVFMYDSMEGTVAAVHIIVVLRVRLYHFLRYTPYSILFIIHQVPGTGAMHTVLQVNAVQCFHSGFQPVGCLVPMHSSTIPGTSTGTQNSESEKF
jgi:hypothetical protein